MYWFMSILGIALSICGGLALGSAIRDLRLLKKYPEWYPKTGRADFAKDLSRQIKSSLAVVVVGQLFVWVLADLWL